MKKFFYFLIVGMLFIFCMPGSTLGQTKSIDCSSEPKSLGSSWSIVFHQPDGKYIYDSTKVASKLVQMGTPNKPISGKEMLKRLGDTGLNSCVYEFILDQQELAPKSWRGKDIVFTGTTLKDSSGNECLRCLRWWKGEWSAGVVYLNELYDDKYAVVK